MSGNYVRKMRADYQNLKTSVAMQALANYIVMSFEPSEQDELIERLQDKTKQAHIELKIYFTDRKDTHE